MSAPKFGVQFSRNGIETKPALGADFSKILVIETSSDASNTEFPVDTPKRISSGDPEAVAALGTGLLAAQVRGINDQLTGLNYGADVTIFRVAEGEDAEDTASAIADVVGSLTSIPSAVNATPRIVVAGRTAWRKNLETTNPVVAALQANLGKILAIAPVDVDDTANDKAIDARETMNSERIIPIGVAAKVYEGSSIVTRPMSGRVAGLFARVDNQNGGYPFKPIANHPLYGMVGLSRKIPFSLLDGSSAGQQLLEANVSIVAEGETGVDGAIADGGFVFIGTDNASTGAQWNQIHQIRGEDYIVTQILKITRDFLGKNLISARLVEAWVDSIMYALRDHKAAERILGYAPRNEVFKPDANSPENIRLGTLSITLGIEQAPSFKLANHEITPYRPAVEGLVNEIMARLSSAV